MSLFELYPLILFALSIIFTIVLHIQKSHKLNLNEVKKTIRDESDKAIKMVDQKVIETEEIVNIKKVEAEDTCSKLDSRIKELEVDSAELDQLKEALFTYRNMLAQLNVATDQTHSYIVQTNSDATKLQKLRKLIDSQESKTYEILQSFDAGVKEQKFQLQNLESELQSQGETALNEIISARDDSLSRINDQIEKYQSLYEQCDQIQSKHNVILDELIKQQNVYETKLNNINEDFDAKLNILVNDTKANLEKFVSQIELLTTNKFSAIQDENIKSYEKSLETKKEETLIEIDRVLKSSVSTINEYNNSLAKPLDSINVSDNVDNSDDRQFEEIKITENLDLNQSQKNNKVTVSKIERNSNKKNKKKQSLPIVDLLDLEPNLEGVLKQEESEQIISDSTIIDSTNFDVPDEDSTILDEFNITQLESIESDVSKKQIDNIDEEIDNSSKEKVDELLSEKEKNDEKANQIKKLSGTGFGSLLNSYGTNKKQENTQETMTSEPKSFKPGSILEKLVEGSEKIKLPLNSVEKIEIKESFELAKKIEPAEKLEESEKTNEEENIIEIDDSDSEKSSKNSTFVAIGEEEEILLD